VTRALRAATLCVAAAAGCHVQAATAPPSPRVDVRTDDVERFFRVYDAAHGAPSADALQRQYLDTGSPGLHQFVVARIGSAAQLAAAVRKWPEAYANARRCMSALPAVQARLPAVFDALARLDPQATFPPVTIVVGRNNSGGTTTAAGVILGLEAICRSTWMQPDPADRLVHLIAHEYAHVQQPAAQVDAPKDATLLFQALLEGGAEFIAEATSGEVSNVHLLTWTRGRECQIERDFAANALGTDVSHWLYNGPGTPAAPGDLGYWVGWRIVKAYVARAPDKRQAVADILGVNNDNAPALLAQSGWTADADCHDAAASQRSGATPVRPTASSAPAAAASRTPARSG
jgi:hypothetical protein